MHLFQAVHVFMDPCNPGYHEPEDIEKEKFIEVFQNFFLLLQTLHQSKLECLFQVGQMFSSKARAYPLQKGYYKGQVFYNI
jgi:hypothetical protein